MQTEYANTYKDCLTGITPTGAGAKYLAAVGTSTAATLATLMTVTGANANTKNALPVFVSQTDLHLVAGSNPQLEDSGIPVTGVTTDFDNQTRTSTPDIGADEISSACTAPGITTQPSAASACTGGNASFTIAATGTGLSYQWKKGGVNVAGATGQTYSLTNLTAAEAGAYTVTVSNACGSITSNSVNLTVTASPTSAFTTALNQCAGTSYSYTNSSTAGATYLWNFGDGTSVSALTNPNHIYVVAGNYTATLTVTANGCSASSTRLVSVTTCTALPAVDENISGVRIMPNLVSSDAVLRVVASRSSNISWSISDEQGRVVMKFNRMATAGQNDINLSLSRLPSGIYQLNGLTSKGVTETVRFVKK
jgi:PKD repeat protein